MPEFKPLALLILAITFHIVMFLTTALGMYLIIVNILRFTFNIELPTPLHLRL
jgi:hypothetical protein